MATTTNYSWSTPDDTALVKDGASAIRTLGSSVDSTLYTALGGAYPGLRLIKKQTIGTAVTSVTVTNAFSATYQNYLILVSDGTASASGVLRLQLGATTSNYQTSYLYADYASGAVASVSTASGSFFNYCGLSNTSGQAFYAEVNSPFLAKRTTVIGHYAGVGDSGTTNGYLANTTSYTDFTILTSSGNMTGGTIYVYGYGIS
jgi:hypothetical protein